MKSKLLFYFAIIVALSSCKEEYVEQRDLEISVELKSEVLRIKSSSKPIFFPNPFDDVVSLVMGDSLGLSLNINTVNAFKKLDLSGKSFAFDFSQESSGTYNCEILVGDKVYKTLLIKR